MKESFSGSSNKARGKQRRHQTRKQRMKNGKLGKKSLPVD